MIYLIYKVKLITNEIVKYNSPCEFCATNPKRIFKKNIPNFWNFNRTFGNSTELFGIFLIIILQIRLRPQKFEFVRIRLNSLEFVKIRICLGSVRKKRQIRKQYCMPFFVRFLVNRIKKRKIISVEY